MTSTDAPPFAPGVYDQMPEDVYHQDPVPGGSLSASGAKKILACPARFAHDRDHPPAPTAAMELGTAAHKLVLGVGAQLVKVDHKDWRTNDAKDQAKAARDAGKVPLLAADYQRAEDVAAAIRDHPIAGKLFDAGLPEQSLFWEDPGFGITRRARLDWLPFATGQRLIVPDLKSCTSADPKAIARQAVNLGYHIQAAWYLDGIRALGLDSDPAFLFVFVETAPPYLITVVQLDEDAMAAGRHLGREACERFRDCQATGIWPAYTDDIALISLPAWARTREDYL